MVSSGFASEWTASQLQVSDTARRLNPAAAAAAAAADNDVSRRRAERTNQRDELLRRCDHEPYECRLAEMSLLTGCCYVID